MRPLTKKESEVLLLLFKEFSKDYNANSLAKVAGITPRGALKIVKSLKSQGLLISKQLGKAVFYKVNLQEYYAFRTVEALLMQEAREKVPRWIFEFNEIYPDTEIAIIFGSAVKDIKKANDIDLILVFKEQKVKKIKKFIEEKNRISIKPIHLIMQTPSDLRNNLRKKDKVIVNALKYGYILHGYDKCTGMVKDVTGF
ncbi:nucleotidyltransferase domain-containing protein [Candidatus Woesearchaeota archaeon]|nr:nucleotidyltransferase domain-containing protein [Candidatus Woesearchaeota archaeon]